MAIIKAFKGLRPARDLVEKVAELPYDVLNSAEAKEIAGDNKNSFFHVTKPEICLLYTSPSPRDVEESRMPSSA